MSHLKIGGVDSFYWNAAYIFILHQKYANIFSESSHFNYFGGYSIWNKNYYVWMFISFRSWNFYRTILVSLNSISSTTNRENRCWRKGNSMKRKMTKSFESWNDAWWTRTYFCVLYSFWIIAINMSFSIRRQNMWLEIFHIKFWCSIRTKMYANP